MKVYLNPVEVYLRKYTAVCLLLPLFVCAVEAQSFYSGQAARAVIGQTTFSAGTANAQAYILGGASGVAYSNGYLWIADSNKLGFTPSNNRVLLFSASEVPGPKDDLSTVQSGDVQCHLCGFPAFNVLGQADYMSNNPGSGNSATPGVKGTGYMQTPSGVATDGTILAVADTDNNRVLIWNSLPLASIGIQPNIVLGQANFTAHASGLTRSSLAGPVGVWVQNGKLFVADTSNSRVLIWNSIPTQSGQPADLVLGEPDFTSRPGRTPSSTAANRLYFPTSVTSDGTRLFVADTGNSRVLIWNSIPTTTDQPADLVLGQPDMTSMASNNTGVCGGSVLCAASLNFPAFALSDGAHLYVSDTGDNRVLVFNSIPTANSANADVVLGQPSFSSDINTSQTVSITSTVVDNTGAVDTVPSPTGLAWDGANLYVSDPSNRRVLLFTPADTPLPDYSVVNTASGPAFIRQEGIVSLFLTAGGVITANDTVSISIQSKAYTYTVKAGDTLDAIAKGLVSAINTGTGDPNVTALFAGAGTASVYLSSKIANAGFDSILLSTTSSNTANVNSIASGGYLTSGTAGTGSAGMLVEIDGTNLSDTTNSNANQVAAQTAVQVYMDGLPVPLFSISPTQIIAQVPFSFTNGTAPSGSISSVAGTDRNSVSVYVRTVHNNGSVTVTNATPLYIAPANPGLFDAQAFPGQPRPWPALNAFHQSGNPNVIVSVDGSVHAGDIATLTINSRNYTYTVVAADTLTTIQNALINKAVNDPDVTASRGAAFNRIVLTARVSGAAGTGIPVSATVSGTGATLLLSAYSAATCCNVTPNSLITPANPAAPGELINVNATGLGILSNNTATNTVTATLGGSDAQVISAGLVSGSQSAEQIQMIVPTNLSPNQFTQLYVAQNAFISNIVTIPVGSAVQAGPPGVGFASSPLVVGPPTLVFANQNLGMSRTTQSVTVYNPGAAAQSVNVDGGNLGSFAMGANSCGASLAPLTSCTVNITYNTGGTGVNRGSLTISAAGSLPQVVSLTGYTVAGFEILSRYSGAALDVTGYSSSDGAVLQQWAYLSGANQQWSFVPVGDGSFTIVSSLSGKVLDVTGLSTVNGAIIQQWDSLGTANQRWTLVLTPDGYYKIRNVMSGKVLDVTGLSTANGAVIQQWDSYADPGNQQWQIVPVQYYKIRNLNSGKVLDVQGTSNADGALIQQWDSYADPGNQQFQLIPVPGSGLYFSIMSRRGGKVFDVINQSTQSDANIQQYDSLARTNQQWSFLSTDVGGAFEIENNASGRALDMTGFSTVNGALVQQWDYLSGANQKWVLVPLGVQ